MAATANQLRIQMRRQKVAAKKKLRHAKGKVLRSPAMRTLKIRA